MVNATFYKHRLYPIYTADLLLNSDKRQQLLTNIVELLDAPDHIIDEYCLPLINNIAELLQELPAINVSRFDYLGGALDFILERCGATLRLFNDYLGESNATDYVLAQPEVWRYTLFSVALLQHMGLLVSHYEFILFDEDQESIGVFSPFSGSMCDQGKFYQAIYNKHGDNQERNTATLLLARQLVPTIALTWINQFREAFHFWTVTLIGESIDQDGHSGGGPTQILTEALARILNRSLSSKHLKQPKNAFFTGSSHIDESKKSPSMAALIGKNADDDRLAEKFLKELEESLDLSDILEDVEPLESENRIRVNRSDSPVHVVQEENATAWFVSLEHVRRYAGQNWQQLVRQLMHTGKIINSYPNAQLSLGPNTMRPLSGFTVQLVNTNSPLQISTILKPVANAAVQQIANMQKGNWPAKIATAKAVEQVANNTSQQLFSSK